MSVKEVTEKYQCSDGRTFKERVEADRNENLIKAKGNYDAALRQYNASLVEFSITADGQFFELGVFKTYFYIRHSSYGMPLLFEVPYLGWNFDVSTENDKVIIHHQEGDRRLSFRVSEVYADKQAAEWALLEKQKEALKDYSEDVSKLEARLNAKRS